METFREIPPGAEFYFFAPGLTLSSITRYTKLSSDACRNEFSGYLTRVTDPSAKVYDVSYPMAMDPKTTGGETPK